MLLKGCRNWPKNEKKKKIILSKNSKKTKTQNRSVKEPRKNMIECKLNQVNTFLQISENYDFLNDFYVNWLEELLYSAQVHPEDWSTCSAGKKNNSCNRKMSYSCKIIPMNMMIQNMLCKIFNNFTGKSDSTKKWNMRWWQLTISYNS